MENRIDAQVENILRVRAEIYRILRDLFYREPTQELLERLSSHPILKAFSERHPNEGVRKTSKNLMEAGRELIEKELTDTWAEFTRLFIGPGKPVAIPFESVNRNERSLKGEIWTEIRDWLLDSGYILEEKSVLEDHIAVEFEYMMLSSIDALESFKRGKNPYEILAKQQEFMEEHLLRWVPGFTENIIENSTSSFYRCLAEFTANFIEDDCETLRDVITKVGENHEVDGNT